MSSLSLDEIANLLGDDSIRPKPRQAGPLKYHTKLGYVCSVCSVPAGVEVDGRIYCSSHAIYALNELCLVNTPIPQLCNCDAGRRTMFSLHTADCEAYHSIPE